MRKTATIVVPVTSNHVYGRDEGKSFLLTEMPASQAEDWAIRAAGSALRSGLDIPPSIVSAGFGAICFLALQNLMSGAWSDVKPLLDEMMACIQSVQNADIRPLYEDDIEEVATRAFLRDEVFRLHANFSVAESLRLVISALSEVKTDDTSLTQTSQGQ